MIPGLLGLLFFSFHWIVTPSESPSRADGDPMERRLTVIEGTQIILRCNLPSTEKGEFEFRFPTNNPPSDLDFTWIFRNKVIVDKNCQVMDKRDVYAVTHTKGFSCHLKVLTPATFRSIGTFESRLCGIFHIVVVSESPNCAYELLNEESRIEYLTSFSKHLKSRRSLKCGKSDVDGRPTARTAVTMDADDPQETAKTRKISSWKIPMENLSEDELNKSVVFKINCTVRYYSTLSSAETLNELLKPILLFTPSPTTYVTKDSQRARKNLHVISGHVVLPPMAEDISVHSCRLLVERSNQYFAMMTSECSLILRKKTVFGDMMAVSILSDACYDLWEFTIFGFVLSTITISVAVTMFSRCTPMGEESVFDESESVLDFRSKSSRRATTTSEISRKKTVVETPSNIPRWRTWIVRPSQVIPQAPPVNFKQMMKELKNNMRHMPPGGKGMMALNSASNSDDLSWYFKSN